MQSRPKKLMVALAGVFGMTLGTPIATTQAETCISPYIKGLTQPEKVMYLWALPATPGEGEDFLAVIDVNLASPTYGSILKKSASAPSATKRTTLATPTIAPSSGRPLSTPIGSSSSMWRPIR